MAGRIAYYGNTVTNGLVLSLDAAKRDSYPGSGTAWRDISGNGNNGTLTNGPTFNSDNGGSFVFDGVDDYVNVIQSSTYQFTNTSAFSLSAWINVTSSGDFNAVISYALGSGDFRGYYLTLISSASIPPFGNRIRSFTFDYYDGTNFRGIMGDDNSITFGSWVMITATSETNSVNGMKIYQNGSLVSYINRGVATPNSINYTGLPLRIGSRENIAFLKGSVANVQIYNRTLSASEILQNYNAQKSRYGL
jgi:hypothetical protein